MAPVGVDCAAGYPINRLFNPVGPMDPPGPEHRLRPPPPTLVRVR